MDTSVDTGRSFVAAASDQDEVKVEIVVAPAAAETVENSAAAEQEMKLEYVVASNEEVAENSNVDSIANAVVNEVQIASSEVVATAEQKRELGSDAAAVAATRRVDSNTDKDNTDVVVNNAPFEDSCSAIPSLRFPQKLWRIVNECRSGAIGWGPDGLSLVIDYDRFQREYLSGSDAGIFKTSNMASFIRQLNLYGFRKLTSHNRDMFGAKAVCTKELMGGPEQKVHEFLHENFRHGRLDLLSRVCRKTGVKKNSQLAKQAKLLKDGRSVKFEENETRTMSRLQMCQFALTEALAQATRQFKKEKQLWLHAAHKDPPKDSVETSFKKPAAEPLQIEIIFQDLPHQLQNVDSIPIIDAAGLENMIDNQEKMQWSEVLTMPGENAVTISVPYL